MLGWHLKPSSVERHEEQAVLLETVAAALAQQYLSGQRLRVELHALAAEHVDVLVRNVLQVQKMQIPQGLQIRNGRSGIPDALEIEIQKLFRHR